MRSGLLVTLALGACYSARPAAGVPCAENGSCPSDQRCDFDRSPPTCVDDTLAIDAAITIDTPVPNDTTSQPTLPPGATLWLRFEDDPADGAADSAGSHVALCSPCPTVVPGRVGLAHDFSGDVYAVSPASDFAPGTGFTVALWFRPDAVATTVYATLIARLGSAGAPVYGMFYTSDGTIDFYSVPGTTLVGPSLALGAWHHVAFVWDGGFKRGYVDGVQVASEPVDSLNDAPNPLGIGNYSTSDLPFDGAIDELLFYPRALGANEIAQLAGI